MDIEEEKKVFEDWLRHPGTLLISHKLRVAAKHILREYDDLLAKGDFDKAREKAIVRKVLLRQIPMIVENAMNLNAQPRFRTWKFTEWLKGIFR